MTSWLINYADLDYLAAQKRNSETALRAGGFDRVISYSRADLDAEFFARNRHILNVRLGAGSWLWKPYIVLKTLREKMADGDMLFYCDADCEFIAPAAPVLDICAKEREKPVVLFLLHPSYTNRRFTKRDTFVYMGLDRPNFTDAVQTLSGYFVCRKTSFTLAFFEEWLTCAQDARILTGMPNQCGKPNYPDFFEHRADQSILSLLGCKHDILAVPDISQWGNSYRHPSLPQIIHLTTRRD